VSETDIGDIGLAHERHELTPSQTVGPYFAYGLTPGARYPFTTLAGSDLVTEDTVGEVIEIVTYTVTALCQTAKPELPRLAGAQGPPVPLAERRVLFAAGAAATPIHRRESLRAGHAVPGPALVEEAASVTVVEPGQRLTVDLFGHLLIDGA
jgi:hypothetical protein